MRILGIKANSIIKILNNDPAFIKMNQQGNLACIGMLYRILKQFTDDPVQVRFYLAFKTGIFNIIIECYFNFSNPVDILSK